LRRNFGQTAGDAARLLSPWWSHTERVLPTSATVATSVLGRAEELDLGGNVHDALIAQACAEGGVGLATLDRNQHRVALALGVDSSYLLT